MAKNSPARRSLLLTSQSAIVLSQILAVMPVVSTTAAQAPPRAAAAYPTVTPTEVAAFMQSLQKDTNSMFRISSNPKRVPLLLAALKREPAGPWANLLLGSCFQQERIDSRNLPPASRAAISAQAIVYLTAAKTTLAEAAGTGPQNRQLSYNLKAVEQALALAGAESLIRTNDARALVGLRLDSKTVPLVSSVAPNETNPAVLRAKACGSSLTQIDLAKQMWQVDYNKPQDAMPTVANLNVYLPYRKLPKCPAGGTYVIGKLSQKPTCSIAGHVMPPESK
jgi:hypothetical protein